METCYLLISLHKWKAFSGDIYFPENYEAEGFIHLCKKDQIEWVANSFLKEVDDLAALELDLEPLKANVQWADVPGVGCFPHLHAGLPKKCVQKIATLSRAEDGGWKISF